jgi:hypothetical protein
MKSLHAGASMIGWTHKEHHTLNLLEKVKVGNNFFEYNKVFCTLVYITKLNIFQILNDSH